MKLTKNKLQKIIIEEIKNLAEMDLTHAQEPLSKRFSQALETGKKYSAAEKSGLEAAMKNQLKSAGATPEQLEKAFQIWARNYPTMKTAQDALAAAQSNLPLVGDIPR
jgi:hypothetical protein